MAKRFRFRLETVLKVRRLREREAERNVAAKSAEIARVDQLNALAAAEISEQQALLLQNQQQGRLNTGELTRARAWVASLRSSILQRQGMREHLTGELAGLQASLREARKQTRIIEKLRERRWNDYLDHRKTREQAQADEMAQQLHIRAAKDEELLPCAPDH